MDRYVSPVLTLFASCPSNGFPMPPLEVDRSTGLSCRLGMTVPFIEELIVATQRWPSVLSSETVLSRAADPVDPDLIRAYVDPRSLANAISTTLTEAPEEPDPDLIRCGVADVDLIQGMSTTVTKMELDQPDPDWIRYMFECEVEKPRWVEKHPRSEIDSHHHT